MRFGLGVLRLAPAEFWRATPRELNAAAQGMFGRATPAPPREKLDEMMLQFPDASAP